MHASTDLWPPLPESVTVANGINLAADDPAHVDEQFHNGRHRDSRRRCIATRKDGHRCSASAMHLHLLCPLHSQRMRADDGGRAKAALRRKREDDAERALSLQKLGTRAVVAEALVAEATNVDKAVKLLCRSAGGGDLQAAKALIPWINQALGMPTERVEHRPPRTVEEIKEMDTEELRRLVAMGREQRLRAARAEPGTARADD